MMEVVNLSSKGQLVIPKSMRDEMNLSPKDKFILVNDKDTILLKKLEEEEVKSKMRSLIKVFTEEFKKAGLKQKDLDREIRAVRKR